jgi:hypothetical protein
MSSAIRIPRRALLAGLVLLSATYDANGAEQAPVALEALPHHLQSRVQVQQAALFPSAEMNAARGVVNRLKAWPPEIRIVKVCFFGGTPQLRTRIINVANRWNVAQSSVRLDFGGPAGRICDLQRQYHIRIGYAYSGYWSLVGQDSYLLASQGEQSLNIQHFDVAPPPDPEFTRVVLHEIGHSLGFEHEHQHPRGTCEQEFNWPVIYKELAGPPNYWDKATVDFNLRVLLEDGLTLGPFDRHSIMLYTFPPRYYKDGTQSSCYAEANDALSASDLVLLAQVYPADGAALTNLRNALATDYVDALTKADVGLGKELDAYVELQKLNQGMLPAKAIAVFSPSSTKLPSNVQLPEELRNARPIG